MTSCSRTGSAQSFCVSVPARSASPHPASCHRRRICSLTHHAVVGCYLLPRSQTEIRTSARRHDGGRFVTSSDETGAVHEPLCHLDCRRLAGRRGCRESGGATTRTCRSRPLSVLPADAPSSVAAAAAAELFGEQRSNNFNFIVLER